MDIRTGEILSLADVKKILNDNAALAQFLKLMVLSPTAKQLARKPPTVGGLGRVGRNEPCPCGSGKKFKKCCLRA